MLAALLISFALGCASPGPPRPPSLHLPQVVDTLTAQRIADGVELHWTTPSRTTDDLDITHPLIAEICRETPISCISVKRLSVTPGPSQATDTLPPALTRDPVALLAYRIQIFNSNGHSAGLSAEAFALSGAAPPSVEHLRATLVRSGIQFEWQPQATSASVQLDRFLVAAQPAKPQPVATAKTKRQSDLNSPPPAEVHLEASSQPSSPDSDPGGVIDRTVQRDQTYRYTAMRVRKLTLAGHALELHSLSSPPITVVTHDTFPPVPPSGLAAIPSGASPRNPSPHLSIDLSWEPLTDLDVAGYIVYRQQVDPSGTLTGPSIRLTPTPVVSPSFSDRTATPGQTYAYRITAIDTTGNESAPSADVNETLRNP
jgi:hypothetical protein